MTKYRVKRAWHGVNVGQEFEADILHPALLPNVEEVPVVEPEPEDEKTGKAPAPIGKR